MWEYRLNTKISILAAKGEFFKICGVNNAPIVLSETSFGVKNKLDPEQEKQLSLACNFERRFIR